MIDTASRHTQRDDAPVEASQLSSEKRSSFSTTDVSPPSESRNRRLLELRLLHYFITKTSKTIFGDTRESVVHILETEVPCLAFTNDGLLYSILAISALHVAAECPSDADAMDAHRRYLDLTLQAHTTDIYKIDENNAVSHFLIHSSLFK